MEITIFLGFSYDFSSKPAINPMEFTIFPWFSYDLSSKSAINLMEITIFPWFSYDFSSTLYVFPWFFAAFVSPSPGVPDRLVPTAWPTRPSWQCSRRRGPAESWEGFNTRVDETHNSIIQYLDGPWD